MFRLAENLDKTVSELAATMSLYEFSYWIAYRQHYGFKIDRLEWATANGASAMCHAWGAKVAAEKIVPHFGPRGNSIRQLIYSLASLSGATVSFVPKDKNRPILTGDDALATLDEENLRDSSRLLSGGKRPEKPKTLTLGGD